MVTNSFRYSHIKFYLSILTFSTHNILHKFKFLTAAHSLYHSVTQNIPLFEKFIFLQKKACIFDSNLLLY